MYLKTKTTADPTENQNAVNPWNTHFQDFTIIHTQRLKIASNLDTNKMKHCPQRSLYPILE